MTRSQEPPHLPQLPHQHAHGARRPAHHQRLAGPRLANVPRNDPVMRTAVGGVRRCLHEAEICGEARHPEASQQQRAGHRVGQLHGGGHLDQSEVSIEVT